MSTRSIYFHDGIELEAATDLNILAIPRWWASDSLKTKAFISSCPYRSRDATVNRNKAFRVYVLGYHLHLKSSLRVKKSKHKTVPSGPLSPKRPFLKTNQRKATSASADDSPRTAFSCCDLHYFHRHHRRNQTAPGPRRFLHLDTPHSPRSCHRCSCASCLASLGSRLFLSLVGRCRWSVVRSKSA